MRTSLKPDQLYFKKQIYILLLVTVIACMFFIPFCLFALGEKESGSVLIIGGMGWLILCSFILFLGNTPSTKSARSKHCSMLPGYLK